MSTDQRRKLDVAIVDRIGGHVVVALAPARGLKWATAVLCALIVVLPWMVGQRTPETLLMSQWVMVSLTGLSAGLVGLSGAMRAPSRVWWLFGGGCSAVVALQVLPWPDLAQWLGPYPDAVWTSPDAAASITPTAWSPDVGATLRGWSVFVAVLTIAWLVAHLPRRLRMWLWVAVVISASAQALYGLVSHASNSTTVLGIWERNNVDFVHGAFSNRNVFAGYLALIWPLAMGVWFIRRVPAISKLPDEMKLAGSFLSAGLVGAAMLGSASRLGSAAGVFGIALTIALWHLHRRLNQKKRVWPVWVAAAFALLAATWYGIMPLAERLVATTGEESRWLVWQRMVDDAPLAWWVHGVGLGGFEAAFKALQPAQLSGGWYDYAHNDLLQWVFEMGLVGVVMLVGVGGHLWARRRLDTERACVYAGLVAVGLVALGDFSWHIPATQVVIAVMVGAALKKPPNPDRPVLSHTLEIDH